MQNNEQETRRQQAAFWLDYSRRLSTTIRYSEALAAIERSLALDDSNAEAFFEKGTNLAMLARYDEALQAFEHTLQLDPHSAPAWDGKAWVLGIQGKKQQALEAVNRALELDPEYYAAQQRRKRLAAME